jgi:hypothetical protein
VDGGDFGVRFRRQKAEQVGGHFAFSDLSN